MRAWLLIKNFSTKINALTTNVDTVRSGMDIRYLLLLFTAEGTTSLTSYRAALFLAFSISFID